ncbi:hypothetical protein [Paludisphaera rhizosphaerae]|uniref:hypothetical protein n=1 Tax=Paludisphaera rhizosphaerae TaxID=2711216 RepID=UPI0013EE2186|nr:hypothetical protein [Paludisphaera rhizosphaerae]
MRCFGKRRGSWIGLGLAAVLGMSLAASVRADLFHSTLPKEVPAYDFNTGGEYFAPPVPYGHYAKDPHGDAAKALGYVTGPIHGLKGKFMGLGHGAGCGHGDGCGHGLGHGLGSGCGLGHGLGSKCGLCSGLGGCKHGGPGIGSGLAGLCGSGDGCGLGAKVKNFGPCHPTGVVATSQSAPSPQVIVDPCGVKGCGMGGLHNHLSGLAGKLKCKLCGGGGCGGCGGAGFGDPCSSCHGSGCGLCGGCGLLSKLKKCMHCGGAGCKHCLGLLKGKLAGLFGPKFEYFVGAGGPVPLTPGYVPYIVTTRSPRDFFAFPPRNPDGF